MHVFCVVTCPSSLVKAVKLLTCASPLPKVGLKLHANTQKQAGVSVQTLKQTGVHFGQCADMACVCVRQRVCVRPCVCAPCSAVFCSFHSAIGTHTRAHTYKHAGMSVHACNQHVRTLGSNVCACVCACACMCVQTCPTAPIEGKQVAKRAISAQVHQCA